MSWLWNDGFGEDSYEPGRGNGSVYTQDGDHATRMRGLIHGMNTLEVLEDSVTYNDENDGSRDNRLLCQDPIGTLTKIMDTKAEDLLNSLSDDQLVELAENVCKIKKEREYTEGLQCTSLEKENMQCMPISSRGIMQKYALCRGDAVLGSNPYEGAVPEIKNESLGGGMLNSEFPSVDSGKVCLSGSHRRVKNDVDAIDGINGSLCDSTSDSIDYNGEDVEYLTFAYSTKGDIKEYTIRVDIECVDLSEIPDGFKLENCVYPRACTTIENYTGNRYEYESKVNELAWRLTWMNYAVLGGKRGLIQRAVDSYRNRFQESRSRRVIRQDKINNGTLRRRVGEGIITTHIIGKRGRKKSVDENDRPVNGNYNHFTMKYQDKRGKTITMRIRCNIHNIDMKSIDIGFIEQNCLFSYAAIGYNQGNDDGMYFFERYMNEIGWKLACLNRTKLSGKKHILTMAVEAFVRRFDPAKAEYLDCVNYEHKGLNGYFQDSESSNGYSDKALHLNDYKLDSPFGNNLVFFSS